MARTSRTTGNVSCTPDLRKSKIPLKTKKAFTAAAVVIREHDNLINLLMDLIKITVIYPSINNNYYVLLFSHLYCLADGVDVVPVIIP